jgi:hypothetical protein
MVRNTQVASRPCALSYNGETIRRNTDGMVSLTDMWKAEGSPPHKAPAMWLRLDVTRGLVEFLVLNMRQEHVLKTKSGKGGATWVVPNLAVAYAKYLSPQFYAWANQVILERIEEEANPELGIARSRARAVAAWKRKGKPGAWIQRRLDGIDVRHQFTDVLQQHGVEGFGYAACTNAIYRPVLGGTASEVKKVRDLSTGANLRDHMTTLELASVSFAESLSEKKIADDDLHGNAECEKACRVSGTIVADALEEAEKPRRINR